MKRLALKPRQDGVSQHHVMGTDLLPLRKMVLPDDPAVERPQVLRGSPRTIARRVLSYSRQNYPATLTRQLHLIHSSPDRPMAQRPDLLRLFRRWNVTHPDDQLKLAQEYAVHHRGTRDIALLSPAVDDLAGSTWAQRALGVYGIGHEYWHALRAQPSTIWPDPFEEGSAEVFGNLITRRLTGYRLLPEEYAYPEFRRGAINISRAAAPDRPLEWLLSSRQVPDLQAWLAQELKNVGVSHDKVQILAYYAGTAEWLVATNALEHTGGG